MENGQPSTYLASPASLASQRDLHAWQGDLVPEDMESQQACRPDHGQDPVSEEAAIAGGGVLIARQGMPAQECAETPLTCRNSLRMESVPEEHLGMSVQRSYGP